MNPDEIMALLQTYKSELSCLNRVRALRWCKGATGQYDDFEGCVLYCMIRELQPRRILEIGCGGGYSTLHILSSLKANGFGECASYDLVPGHVNMTRNRVKLFGLTEHSVVRYKDIREEGLRSLGKFDMLFVDTHHTYDMARWWINNLIPLLSRDVVLVHDILHLGDGPERHEEWKAVKSFIDRTGWKYALIHRVWNQVKSEVGWLENYVKPSTPNWRNEANPSLWMIK